MAASSAGARLIQVLPELIVTSLATVCTALLLNRMLNPQESSRRQYKEDLRRLRERFGVSGAVSFSPTELQVIECVVIDPASIEVTFESIGGQVEMIGQLREAVLLPLLRPDLFMHSKLLKPTRGILLHGPPGTGKTMLAKAMAKEAGCAFLNVSPASMLSKWYGESQKRVAAIWSVAFKLQPALIFVDEIDCCFRERSSSDHEATASFQAEWMSQWDGLLTAESSRVLVIGTTNRPNVLDPAIRRRFGRQFYVGVPSQQQRVGVLRLLLEGERLADNVELDALAQLTAGYSGSDLKELARAAAMLPLREFVQAHPDVLRGAAHSLARSDAKAEQTREIRPLCFADFEAALALVPPTQLTRGEISLADIMD